jgi:hypothetical protein
MFKNRVIFLILSLVVFLYFYVTAIQGFYESLSIAFLVFFFLDFLDNLGKKVVVLDIAVLLALFTWLVLPVIFYTYFTKSYHLARIFYKYMPIPAEDYFSFALPGTLMMIAGFKIPLAKLEINEKPLNYRAKLDAFFKGKAYIGFILIGISLVSGTLYNIFPASLGRVVGLMEHLGHVGVFYIYFSGHPHRMKILFGVLALLMATSIATGMFGEMVYLLAIFYILIALYSKQQSLWTKITVCLAAVILIFLIQSVKSDYRKVAWVSGGDSGLFLDMVSNAATHPSALIEKDVLFRQAVRLNQGWLIAVTMDRVPRKYDYAYGETIWISLAASVVPRFIWPDKPEAGGKYNLKRFWGYNLVGYSMNIGPIGEAYANFGTTGGIIFMFFYGLFFNLMLVLLLRWSEKRPSVLCWIPFLFFYAVVVETDILTSVGSIMTSLMFMVVFIRLFKAVTKISL